MALLELSLFLKVGAVAAKTSPAQDSASLVAPAESSAQLQGHWSVQRSCKSHSEHSKQTTASLSLQVGRADFAFFFSRHTQTLLSPGDSQIL